MSQPSRFPRGPQPEFGYLTVVLPVAAVVAMARTASVSGAEQGFELLSTRIEPLEVTLQFPAGEERGVRFPALDELKARRRSRCPAPHARQLEARAQPPAQL